MVWEGHRPRKAQLIAWQLPLARTSSECAKVSRDKGEIKRALRTGRRREGCRRGMPDSAQPNYRSRPLSLGPGCSETVIETYRSSRSDRATGPSRNIVLSRSWPLVGAVERPRARQNVVFELGFFIGKLGRAHVCALCEEGVEIPSDYSGVLFIPIDPVGGWKLALATEMTAAGIPVDMTTLVGGGSS
jgi:hypothetical protein